MKLPKTCKEILELYSSLIGKYYADGYEFVKIIDVGLDNVGLSGDMAYMKCSILDCSEPREAKFYIDFKSEEDLEEILIHIFDSYDEAALFHNLQES